MRIKSILLSLVIIALITSCKKDEIPQQDDYYFTYEVKISNRITEPTIINGYFGHVLLYEGNFMPSTDGETKSADTVRNELYLYEASLIDKIQEVRIQRNGVEFYDLKALEKNEVKPKIIIKPNKHGFYQVDTNSKEYLLLIEAKNNLGYFKGGPLKVGNSNTQLRRMNMNIDYDATF